MNEVMTLSERQVTTLKGTIAKDCNSSEFNLFVEYCRRIGLDPIRKQVIPLIFNKDNPKKRQMTIVVTVDGQRTIASRLGDYRPDSDEPEITYNDELKNPNTNPAGIEKCKVKLYKQDNRGEWFAVSGVAYWEEFAAIKTWNGESTLDGQWKTKPRIMITKCAESQALRKGWPDQFANMYSDAELDKQVLEDRDASEIVEAYQQDQRMKRIGGEKAIAFVLDNDTGIERIPVGQAFDRFLEAAKKCETFNDIATLRSRNEDSLKEFWAYNANDALALKKEIEAREDELRAKAYDGAA